MPNRGFSWLKLATRRSASRHAGKSLSDVAGQSYAQDTTASTRDQSGCIPARLKDKWGQDFRLYINEHDEFITRFSRGGRAHGDSLYEECVRVWSALPDSSEPLLNLVSRRLEAIDYAETRNKVSADSEDFKMAAFARKLREEDDNLKTFVVALRLMKLKLDRETPSAAGLDISLPELAVTLIGRERYEEIVSSKTP